MIKILLLSAQPRDLNPLRLDEEKRDIEQGLERARHRDRFQLIKKEAVRKRDLRRAVLEEEPQIVHFSGHGGGEEGLALEDDNGNMMTASAEGLAALFELFETLHCVVLNACYSEVQAQAIAQQVPYVVGMNDAIGDRAAIEFAVAFYDALGAGREVPFAFKYARAAIDLADIPESHKPVLLTNEALIAAKKI
ncbi:MAG: CHAT domain-containing protein [Cyanobacteria bacterium]|nr:CHAT domain-containing protein [Cyanobacteriota bacterium]